MRNLNLLQKIALFAMINALVWLDVWVAIQVCENNQFDLLEWKRVGVAISLIIVNVVFVWVAGNKVIR